MRFFNPKVDLKFEDLDFPTICVATIMLIVFIAVVYRLFIQ